MAVNKVDLKRYNGTDWESIYMQSSADISPIGKPIEVTGNLGGYHAGASIPESTPIKTVLEKMQEEVKHPDYIEPRSHISYEMDESWNHYNDGNYPEGAIYNPDKKLIAGQLIHTKIKSTFIKNDAGAVSEHLISVYVNGEPLTSELTGETSNDDSTEKSVILHYQPKPGDVITVKSSITFADGEVKNDSLGNNDPTGQIKSGSITVSSEIDASLNLMVFAVDKSTASSEDGETYRAKYEEQVQDNDAVLAVAGARSVGIVDEQNSVLIIGVPAGMDLSAVMQGRESLKSLVSGTKRTIKVPSYSRLDTLTSFGDVTLRDAEELKVDYDIYKLDLGQNPDRKVVFEVIM